MRFGQSAEARVVIETKEETNLDAQVVSNGPVSEHLVGEEEHLFSAFEIVYTGGAPMARPTKEEPITAIIFVGEEELLNACLKHVPIEVGGLGPVMVKYSHRKVFLEFLRKKEIEKTAPSVVEEAVNV